MLVALRGTATSSQRTVTMLQSSRVTSFGNYAPRTYDSKNDYAPAKYRWMTMTLAAKSHPTLSPERALLHLTSDAQPSRNASRLQNGKTASILARQDWLLSSAMCVYVFKPKHQD